MDGMTGSMDERTLVNVWQDTTLCDCDVSQELVQLLVVADGELKMTGNDTGLFVVARGVTSQLEDFGCEVLENGGQVDWGTSTDTLSIVALSKETVNTTNWESETSLGRTTVREQVSQTVRVVDATLRAMKTK